MTDTIRPYYNARAELKNARRAEKQAKADKVAATKARISSDSDATKAAEAHAIQARAAAISATKTAESTVCKAAYNAFAESAFDIEAAGGLYYEDFPR